MGIKQTILNKSKYNKCTNCKNYNELKNVLSKYLISNDIIKIIWFYQKSFNLNLLFDTEYKNTLCTTPINIKYNISDNYKIVSVNMKYIKLSYFQNDMVKFIDIPKCYSDFDGIELVYNTNDIFIHHYKSDYYIIKKTYIITKININRSIDIVAKDIETNKIKYSIKNVFIQSRRKIIGIISEEYIILYKGHGIYIIYDIETGILLHKFTNGEANPQKYSISSFLKIVDKDNRCEQGRFVTLAHDGTISINNSNTKKTKYIDPDDLDHYVHVTKYNEIIMMKVHEKEKYGKLVHVQDKYVDVFYVNNIDFNEDNDLTYIGSYYINHNTNLHKSDKKNINKWSIIFIEAISDKHFIIGYLRECCQNKGDCILKIFDIETGKQYETWASKNENMFYDIVLITNNKFIIISDNTIDFWEMQSKPLKIAKTKSIDFYETIIVPKSYVNGYLFVCLSKYSLLTGYDAFAIYN
jgi:hypothetical protein